MTVEQLVFAAWALLAFALFCSLLVLAGVAVQVVPVLWEIVRRRARG